MKNMPLSQSNMAQAATFLVAKKRKLRAMGAVLGTVLLTGCVAMPSAVDTLPVRHIGPATNSPVIDGQSEMCSRVEHRAANAVLRD